MPGQIDYAYNTQRRRILNLTAAGANRLWVAGGYNDRETFLQHVVAVVEAGQRQTVSLLSAYMTHKARTALNDPHHPYIALNPDDFTVEKLRGVPADEVYARPFGTIGARMAAGVDFAAAAATAGSYVTKLAATDVQLAQTYGAKAWVAEANAGAGDGGSQIVGYNRVTGGECCAFCETAAEQSYHTDDLMPIHEGCTCGVEPIYGDAGSFHSGEGSGAIADDELGARLP